MRDSGASDLEQLHRLHTTPFTGALLYRSLSLDDAAGNTNTNISTNTSTAMAASRRGKRTRTRTRTLSAAISPHTVAGETIAEEALGRRRAVEEPGEPLDEVLLPRGPRQESDGGVRLAGGRPDELFGDTGRHGQSDSPLPPPYHPY